MKTVSRNVLGLSIALGFAALSAAAFAQTSPEPFKASYNVEWRGIGAGRSTLELKSNGPNAYTYTSSNVARGLFRLAFPDAITQRSDFSIVNGVVRPLVYRADDGSSNGKRAVTLYFNWDTMRVTGTAETVSVDQPLKPGTQDGLSVQVELMCQLAAGRSPARFWLINKDEVTDYEYTREPNQTLDTPLGKLDTIVYRSQHPGSSRVTRLWFAPTLGFLPVRAEQFKRGKSEFALTLRSATRNPPST